jgi:hypothetical protein
LIQPSSGGAKIKQLVTPKKKTFVTSSLVLSPPDDG